jgi:hypothetical protein
MNEKKRAVSWIGVNLSKSSCKPPPHKFSNVNVLQSSMDKVVLANSLGRVVFRFFSFCEKIP